MIIEVFLIISLNKKTFLISNRYIFNSKPQFYKIKQYNSFYFLIFFKKNNKSLSKSLLLLRYGKK